MIKIFFENNVPYDDESINLRIDLSIPNNPSIES